ncbi:hypothetical protein [Polaribacter ponticola]|uniref:Lipoprotein n=1 Tax=Polaribacter ponticola TaxID=2978475 RepID=A0ABT5SBM2_9FLAO|nr:hypothetical protein [Polaribacter sp. MSW5]MDD7915517.1 hypothetical protein [Polaribacter sp. MSW5]
MKKLYTAALVLFIACSFSAKKITSQENKVIATYNSITDKGFYKFIDAKNVEHLFYDLDGSLDIELEDENYLDKKFSITWKTKEIDELDDEGEETGNKITVKIIFTIKEEK